MAASQRLILPMPVDPSSTPAETAFLGQSLASVPLLLGAGGDQRISPDPVHRRNRYGTLTTPAEHEISFSSTTASNVSGDGFRAAGIALERLVDRQSADPVAIDRWFADIRKGIATSLGCTDATIILAASGTDAELMALCLFAGLSARPLTNILVAPEETGSGVPRAASGCHYSDLAALGSTVEAGKPLEGLDPERIEVCTVAIRNGEGEPRRQEEIDDAMIAAVERELKRDRDVLVHVLDTSKTGLSGVTRQAARHAALLAPGRVHVIVDACQFRCSASDIRQDLADGFLVVLTGSKFVGGPPFSGALLVPTSLGEALATRSAIPSGLSAYTAAHDWPSALREKMDFTFGSHFNLGLGLRWVAASAALDRYAVIQDDEQALIKAHFVKLVRARIDSVAGIRLHANDEGAHLDARTIVPFTISNRTGGFASFEHSQMIHLLMRERDDGPVCHLGQAVRLGSRTVLRVAASAADVLDVSARMAAALPLHQAFHPVESRLDAVFDKLAAVLHHVRAL
ncbi:MULTISPECIES: hypothetical protein [unclassified Rhizobium]|uniref:hypothetical protein n=1 Tax=unclassified Rhizobium TaxID=2613769 RepID=UPI001ADB62DD|nr:MULTISPECIES: hypothetical protein [unclassified Rhizobium]MBO9101546.1 hypothetical protein [Rhizobium sp. L58/93]MBO9187539.1 hypothetical protein [Rhizobium sp. E27B/91]QXZ86674.1 hypothetical protein J5287_18815 [Rhizobium sp. K1/93]QXZ93293.1 hypothetical protein J5280_22080 [Rhizobium sp. K15/93]QYA03569.1 hypothetical protein J5278_22445 [Rhizobium sp. B21/90]